MTRLSPDILRYTVDDLVDHAQCPRRTMLAGRSVTRGVSDASPGDAEVFEAAIATSVTMRDGDLSIDNPTFVQDGWVSRVDFLRRTSEPSTLGSFSYEPFIVQTEQELVAAELALDPNDRTFEVAALLRLAEASLHLTRVQGVQPSFVNLVTAGRTRRFAVDEIAPYHRAVRRDFLRVARLAETGDEIAGGAAPEPTPGIVCGNCAWSRDCETAQSQPALLAPARRFRHPSEPAPATPASAMKVNADTANADAAPEFLAGTPAAELRLDLESLVPELASERDNEDEALFTLAQLVQAHQHRWEQVQDLIPGYTFGSDGTLKPTATSTALYSMGRVALLGRLGAVARRYPSAVQLLRRTPPAGATASALGTQSAFTNPAESANADDNQGDGPPVGATTGETRGDERRTTAGATAAVRDVAANLRGGYLAIDGASASERSAALAAVACDAVARGESVALTGPSLEVVATLRDAVEALASERNIDVAAANAPVDADWETGVIDAAVADGVIRVVAGSPAWFARHEAEMRFDLVIVADAHVTSLADTVAASVAGANLVLAGVVDAAESGSAFAHLAAGPAEAITMHLPSASRAHPSLVSYLNSILTTPIVSMPGAEQQWVDAIGAGIVFESVPTQEHDARIAAMMAQLAGATFVDSEGASRPLEVNDVALIGPGETPPANSVAVVVAVITHDDATPERLGALVSAADCCFVAVGDPSLAVARCTSPQQMLAAAPMLGLIEAGSFAVQAQTEIENLLAEPS